MTKFNIVLETADGQGYALFDRDVSEKRLQTRLEIARALYNVESERTEGNRVILTLKTKKIEI